MVKAGPHKVAVLNLMGRVFLPQLDCPFRKADEELERLRAETSIIVVDMHAEATSESQAMGWHLDGRVSAVVGTHRHVQTADERLLPKGTAYITDLGLTGPTDSVIGVEPGAGPRPLPLPDAEPLRARQGAGHAPGRGDPHRSRNRSRAVHRASARPSRRLTPSC